MATASMIDPRPQVHLILTWDEAVTLRDVCRRIAGDADCSRRAHTDQMLEALRMCGVGSDAYAGDVGGSITFHRSAQS